MTSARKSPPRPSVPSQPSSGVGKKGASKAGTSEKSRTTRTATAAVRKKSPSTTANQGKSADGGPRKGAPDSVAVLKCYRELRKIHPDAHCELEHQSAFQLVVATALSAQTTDVAVNKATPGLFAAYPNPKELSGASVEAVEKKINTIGMYRQKAKNIVALAKMLVDEFGGEVPRTQAELVRLPGVGRKTANVVLGVAFGTPEGVVVDTHVQRITQRLGWTTNTTPEAIEQDLMRLLPKSEWDLVSHTLIFHGRRVCAAAKPACGSCGVQKLCPSAFHAETIGRKPPRSRG